mmetsp:Transcript_34781/g.76058  ORF Transcript_34781/g.76058 Transcript_34781/m.76058 type:complete len:419 (+) Transcript_34781:48-1304(+)
MVQTFASCGQLPRSRPSMQVKASFRLPAPVLPSLARVGKTANRRHLVRSARPLTTAAYDRDFALNGDKTYQEAEEVGDRFGKVLSGKTVLITGANSGIGKEAARVLGATCGAKVLLACRSAQSASDTAEELATSLDASSSSSGEFVPIMHPLDLSSLKCVRDTANKILQDYFPEGKPLDVLLCNAGLAGVPDRAVTEDGVEIHFGTNHMGHFLLANTLLPAVLRAPEDGRVVIVSSETHRGRPDAPTVLDLDDLFVEGIPEAMGGFVRYGRSKLANLLYAKQLARRLEGHENVSVYSLCPGLINTGLGRYNDTAEKKAQAEAMYANAAASGGGKEAGEGGGRRRATDRDRIGADGRPTDRGGPGPTAHGAEHHHREARASGGDVPEGGPGWSGHHRGGPHAVPTECGLPPDGQPTGGI